MDPAQAVEFAKLHTKLDERETQHGAFRQEVRSALAEIKVMFNEHTKEDTRRFEQERVALDTRVGELYKHVDEKHRGLVSRAWAVAGFTITTLGAVAAVFFEVIPYLTGKK